MLGNVEKIEAYKHLSEKEKKELKKYAGNLTGYINILNVSQAEKEDIFDTLVEYRANLRASDEYVKKYNAIADKMDELYEKYRKEPDDNKAAQYAEQYREYKEKQEVLKSKYDYFNGKRSALSDRAFKYDKLIDDQLILGIENQFKKRAEMNRRFAKPKNKK